MKKIDLQRYMGDWFVIANIPTFTKKLIWSGRIYRLQPDGSILNVYESNRGSFAGPRKRLQAKAWVTRPETNTEWKVQFVWPVKHSYRILEVADDYSYCVVGQRTKNHVWIMAREPKLESDVYSGILFRLKNRGYDLSKLRRVPQRYHLHVPNSYSPPERSMYSPETRL